MRRFSILLLLGLVVGGCGGASSPDPTGTWSAWLDSPGGKLEFTLTISREDEGYSGEIGGGGETLILPTEFTAGELELGFPHFDSTIQAHYDAGADRLEGEWRKYSGPEKWSSLAFHALRNSPDSAPVGEAQAQAQAEDRLRQMNSAVASAEGLSVDGRWAVDFESEDELAVAVFERTGESSFPLQGTFLTTTGDYRYLWGTLDGDGGLKMQAFDGAHAFLFKAQLQPDGSLVGDFWSRDSWHEGWTAVRDEDAALPDPFALTRPDETIELASLRYPDLDGELRALDDPAFAGRARIVELFGTWCPNCYDATQYLEELQERYGERGLSILGLAFELSGDPVRDTAQLKRYVQTQDIRYPVLLAGTNDKEVASKAFPLIDRVRGYPTFVFIDGQGEVRAVYTGFSGPATGTAHQALRNGFERTIEDLLSGELPPAH